MKSTTTVSRPQRHWFGWILVFGVLFAIVGGASLRQRVHAASDSIDITPSTLEANDPLTKMQEQMDRLMQDPYTLHDDTDPLLDDNFQKDFQRFFSGRFPLSRRMKPLGMVHQAQTDIRQDGDNIVVTLDMPGHDKNSIDLRIKDNVLIIQSERQTKSTTKKDNKSYFRQEISYGQFSQNIRLPRRVIPEKITAKLQNGVLQIVAPLDLNAPKIDEGIKIIIN